MKLIDMKCPGCGAQMLLDRKNKRAYCEYCGTVMLVEDNQDVEKLKTELEEKNRLIHEMQEKEVARKAASFPGEEYKRPDYRVAQDEENMTVYTVVGLVLSAFFILSLVIALAIMAFVGGGL